MSINFLGLARAIPVALYAVLGLLVFFGRAYAGPIIVGHLGGTGAGQFGSILTWDYAIGGTPTSGFNKQSVGDGRAVEVVGGLVYYTNTSSFGSGPSPGIHVAPYNGGNGGADLTTLPNPRPGFNIQDLDFFNGRLYALTGYLPGPQQGPLIVYGLNPMNGQIQTTVTIQGPLPGADGFTVLPNGNFLINDNDAVNVYREYDALTGLLVPSAPVITVKSPTNRATGVDYFNNSLYFYGVFFTQGGLGKPGLLNTDLNGNEI
ncbi:hypothetical protein [Bythopirellula goksoeyrii]|uniref:Uncharacterized protein n=1 Tax=Bythopirellula goksoeyrii TaxID=1400387 RepID=A0A5B9Q9K1_9BACT|nr:hypothetical protein [Bythopirellula goksoeyrii]QEG35714.1 hypothetical protein Pr1d_30170 [Bythopirellula goksoeyrii]